MPTEATRSNLANADKTSTQLQHGISRQIVVLILQLFPSLSKNTFDFLSTLTLREWAHFNQRIFHLTLLYSLYRSAFGTFYSPAGQTRRKPKILYPSGGLVQEQFDEAQLPASLFQAPPRRTRYDPDAAPFGSAP